MQGAVAEITGVYIFFVWCSDAYELAPAVQRLLPVKPLQKQHTKDQQEELTQKYFFNVITCIDNVYFKYGYKYCVMTHTIGLFMQLIQIGNK